MVFCSEFRAVQPKKLLETVRNSPLPGFTRDDEITAHVKRFLLCLQEAKETGAWEYQVLQATYECWCDLKDKQRSWPFRAIVSKLKTDYGARSHLRLGDRKTMICVPDEYEVEAYRSRPPLYQ